MLYESFQSDEFEIFIRKQLVSMLESRFYDNETDRELLNSDEINTQFNSLNPFELVCYLGEFLDATRFNELDNVLINQHDKIRFLNDSWLMSIYMKINNIDDHSELPDDRSKANSYFTSKLGSSFLIKTNILN